MDIQAASAASSSGYTRRVGREIIPGGEYKFETPAEEEEANRLIDEAEKGLKARNISHDSNETH